MSGWYQSPLGYPRLTPTKPERLVVHCEKCQAQLLIGKNGELPECKTCKEKR